MTHHTLIRCPGCETVVEVSRPVCPGCGGCLNCGERRAEEVKHCPTCHIPYCDCCGRCSKCLELRYAEFGLCSCGHPEDEERIQSLMKEFSATRELEVNRLAELFVAISMIAVIVGGVIALILWMQ